MVSTAPSPVVTATPPLPNAQRVYLYNLSWDSYQQILEAMGDHRYARLTYDEGTLEIRMPLEGHENSGRLIERLIIILIVELGLKVKTMGSMTLDRPDLLKGTEPDNGYYIQNQPKVAGKIVNLQQDSAPDLVVEVDITHTDINKPALYAQLGVSEFWRYNGRSLYIYQLQDGKYQEVETSPTFPLIEKSTLYDFLSQCQIDEVEAEIAFRDWVRAQIQQRKSNSMESIENAN
ncbi:Uma2 family endonuclease [Tumidithrix helvetica PCC 7403]|uniref:Uma2 family endonuclease n=1 Tax=Tumidithrix helvetica TaxID=3457545 RepID=UPI003CB57E4E